MVNPGDDADNARTPGRDEDQGETQSVQAIIAGVMQGQQGSPADLLADVISRLAHRGSGSLPQSPAQPSGAAAGSSRPTSAIPAEFMKLKPPSFSGSTDPAVAEAWLGDMERTFDFMYRDLTGEEKVKLATYMLKDGARTWWETLTHQEPGSAAMKWEEFKKKFLEKYFPVTLRFTFEQQFLELRQGTKSVSVYEEEFDKLSKFAPMMVADDKVKARRFLEGLSPTIRQTIRLLREPSFREVVDAALSLEAEQRATQLVTGFKGGDSSGKGKRFSRFRPYNVRPQLNRPQVHQLASAEAVQSVEPRKCFRCQKLGHIAKNCSEPQRCYQCQKLGHYKSECPELKQVGRGAPARGNRGGRRGGPANCGGGRGHLNAICHEDLAGQSDVMTGIFKILEYDVFTLFDTWASFSFVAATVAKSCNLEILQLDEVVTVETPIGTMLRA